MKVNITNIKWDTDGTSIEELGLPISVEIDVPLNEDNKKDYFEYINDFYEYIDNYLSDTYGYCFFGYSLDFI